MTATLITTPILLLLIVLIARAVYAADQQFADEGIECRQCMDTGYSTAGPCVRACRNGCSENPESPYWPLVSAYMR